MLVIASSEGTSCSKCERKKFNEGVFWLLRESDLFFIYNNNETKRNSSPKKEISVIIYSHTVISSLQYIVFFLLCNTKEDLENVIFSFEKIVYFIQWHPVFSCWTPLTFTVWKKQLKHSSFCVCVFRRKVHYRSKVLNN